MTGCRPIDVAIFVILCLFVLAGTTIVATMLLSEIREWIDWRDKRRRTGNG